MLIEDLDVLGAIDIIHDDVLVMLIFVIIVVKQDIIRGTILSENEKARAKAKTKPRKLDKRCSCY